MSLHFHKETSTTSAPATNAAMQIRALEMGRCPVHPTVEVVRVKGLLRKKKLVTPCPYCHDGHLQTKSQVPSSSLLCLRVFLWKYVCLYLCMCAVVMESSSLRWSQLRRRLARQCAWRHCPSSPHNRHCLTILTGAYSPSRATPKPVSSIHLVPEQRLQPGNRAMQ
jgi:hypothetical protein